MSWEPISPELALVDPELAARARAVLPYPVAPQRPARPAGPVAPAPPRAAGGRPYPVWARLTAALWLLVLGILVGGAAIPHAQDTPRLIPANEEATFCKAPKKPPAPEPGHPGQP